MLPPLVSQSVTDAAPASTRRLRGQQRVFGVLLPAVVEMLGVENHLAAGSNQIGHALADHRQVLVASRPQHVGHVKGGGFAHERDEGRAGIEQGPQAGVRFDVGVLSPRHAERTDLDVFEPQAADALEVFAILVVRGRIAAFDVIEAEAVEPLGQGEFVLEREADALALGAVAKRGVVDFDAWHGRGQVSGVRCRGSEVREVRFCSDP